MSSGDWEVEVYNKCDSINRLYCFTIIYLETNVILLFFFNENFVLYFFIHIFGCIEKYAGANVNLILNFFVKE